MSDNLSLDALAAQEAELNAAMEALRQKQAELIKQKQEALKKQEAEKEVIFTLVEVYEMTTTVKIKSNGKPREDSLALLRSLPSRSYRYNDESNTMSFTDFLKFKDLAVKLPNTKVIVSEEQEKQIDSILNAPNYLVDINSKYIVIKPKPSAATWDITNIAGAKRDFNLKAILIPLSEAVRVGNVMLQLENVVYTEEASKYITNEVEKAAVFDRIANLEDAPEIDPKFVDGSILKPFQRVGVKFALEALKVNRGVLIGDQVGLGKSVEALAIARLLKEEWEKNNNGA